MCNYYILNFLNSIIAFKKIYKYKEVLLGESS